VYPLIHLIRVDVLAHIGKNPSEDHPSFVGLTSSDTPLTYEQLLAPDSTYTIVRYAHYLDQVDSPQVLGPWWLGQDSADTRRPLTEKYLELQNQATGEFHP
jgi:hypothetical protein